jgi:hypothetical protein
VNGREIEPGQRILMPLPSPVLGTEHDPGRQKRIAGQGGGRLFFRPVQDTGELLTLMTRALDGTLDAHSHDELTRMSAREAAVSHYQGELARYTSPKDWWQIACLPTGTPAGFVIPARNDYNPIIAYLAVLPEHRGNGYVTWS